MKKKRQFQLKKAIGFGMICTLLVPQLNYQPAAHPTAASKALIIKPEPDSHSAFHDTDGDGFGEFQGFGTSLCWWANRCGYDTTLTSEAARLLYNKDDGLGLTIGRYNIGGGDNPSHAHITRSDSIMPGFWSTPVKVADAEEGSTYDVYDETSGYAWNYNWAADSNQLNVALACQKEAGEEFQAETFSNSAPYFLTVSGCSSGSENGYSTNLRSDSIEAFTTYLTDVTKHLITENGLSVKSISPMNEPESSDWKANSMKQEGCHIDAGKTQSDVLLSLSSKLDAAELTDLTLAGMDSSAVNTSIDSFQALTDSAKAVLERIDTHTYMSSGMTDLRTLATKNNKNLWMSEVDGTVTFGENAGEMASALGFASYLNNQLNSLQPSAWIMWDAIDSHIDTNTPSDLNSLTEEERIAKDTGGFWGVLFANHNTKEIIQSKKYYGYGQYTRYIRPGYTLIGSSDNSVAAYDTKTNTVVIVATNASAANKSCRLDLSSFGSVSSDSKVTVIRTSGTLKDGENWKDVSHTVKNELNANTKQISTTLKKNSITTYIITDVSLAEHNTTDLNRISIHQNQISGKNSSSGSDMLGNMTDGSYDTEYGCKNGTAIIDLGCIYSIDAISYVASCINPNTTRGISVYGSTDKKSWKKLYTITATSACTTESWIWNEQFLAEKKNYRYIKLQKSNGKAGITSVAVYGTTNAVPDATKYPKTLTHVKQLPQKITLKNKKSAKVTSWSFYRGSNDYMTAKQRKTILLSANLNKSLPGYGKSITKNITVNPKNYKQLLGKTFKIKTSGNISKLTEVTSSKKKTVLYMKQNGKLTKKK